MTHAIRWLGTLLVLSMLTLNVSLVWAVVEIPPPPTQPQGSQPSGGGNPGGGTTQPTPEPATVVSAIVGTAVAGLYAWHRRRSRTENDTQP
jgi:hypothetical protein